MSNSFDNICPSRRTDLIIVQRESDAPTWVVKDPIQLNYFVLDEMQYWLFQRLNGINSVASIVEKFNSCFPLKATAEEIYGFCMQMSNDSLLNEVASGEQISQRLARKNKSKYLKIPMSLLSIKLPPVNARGLFDIAENLFSWLFSPIAVLMTVVLFAGALLTVAHNFHTFVAEIPFLESFTAQDIVSFLLALTFVKVLHELGHAVCCRRMGAECNEMGLMFLVFSPCLYCTVTDSWILPQKWKRIAVAAAGVYVELIIAACTLLLWNYCEQPLMRGFFLNIVLICSVSSLLVNGNPLMRYDGYFILSDLTGIPNLATESKATSWNLFSNLLFQSRAKENRFYTVRQQMFMFGYYILSVAYRWVIMCAIFWLAYTKLKSAGLATFALVISSGYAAMMIGMFVVGFGTYLMRKRRSESIRWLGFLLFLAILAGACYFISKVEIERNISAQAIVEFEDYEYCSSPTDGRLVYAVELGSVVEQGDVIVRLENDELEKRIRDLTHEKTLTEIRIQNVEAAEGVDQESQFELPELRARLLDLKTQIANTKQSFERLSVCAPMSGTVVELSENQTKEVEGDLPKHAGSILQPENLGCYIETGEVVCSVCQPDKYVVYLMIDERKLDLIRKGNPIKLFFPSLKQLQFSGKIVGFSRDTLKTDAAETLVSSNSMRAIVELDQPLRFAFHHTIGKARISIEKETVSRIVKRFFVESFRFEL